MGQLMGDLVQGCWQCPLAGEARKIFAIATPKGLLMPTRILQRVLYISASWCLEADAIDGKMG